MSESYTKLVTYSIIFDRNKTQLGMTLYDTRRAVKILYNIIREHTRLVEILLLNRTKITGACYDPLDTENLYL